MEAFQIALSLLGAVALFLLGLDRLGESISAVGTDRIEPILTRMSRNPLLAMLTGIAVTAVLDSSSAVIVLLVALVNTGALSFRNALGIVLGANIGTTVGSQIIALDLEWLAPALLAVGVFGRLFVKRPVVKGGLDVVLSLGLLFLGLELMDVAVYPLRASPRVLDALQSLANPLQGALVGGIVTLVIQSSSATVGIAIGMAKSQVLPLSAGIAVMLGAEIGTCADTLVASVGRSRAALRVGVFHLGFNAVCVALGLLLVEPLRWAAVSLSPGAEAGQHLANAHILFNVAGALIALPFVHIVADVLLWGVPERAPGGELSV